jgi:hypothetical protein
MATKTADEDALASGRRPPAQDDTRGRTSQTNDDCSPGKLVDDEPFQTKAPANQDVGRSSNNGKRALGPNASGEDAGEKQQQTRSSSDEFRRPSAGRQEQDKLKSRLGQVKSLDGVESAGSGPSAAPADNRRQLGVADARPAKQQPDDLRRSSVESASTRPGAGRAANNSNQQQQQQQLRQQQQQQQQRQMFSLKQLTLNKTRNLTGKKRASLSESKTLPSKLGSQDQSTDSNSDETSATRGQPAAKTAGARDGGQDERRLIGGGRGRGQSRSSDEEPNSDSDSSSGDSYFEDESASDEDEEDEEDEEEASDETAYEPPEDALRALDENCAQSRSLSSGDELLGAVNSMKIRLAKKGGQTTGAKTTTTSSTPAAGPKRRRRLRERRRTSYCSCEPTINRIDPDCQPVTDVDLATYKHLCQLEQKQQQLRAYQQRRSRRSGAGLAGDEDTGQLYGLQRQPLTMQNIACSMQTAATDSQRRSGARKRQQLPLDRRSSLQEESGAYYELCVDSEEREIRRKYVWFPPSLKTLQLVDQFFSYFAKDKIPYNPAASSDGAATGQQQQQQQQGPNKDKSQTTTVRRQSAGDSQQVPGGGGAPAAPSLACASYRDEQISLQLPRQDISLDYCSYHMDDASRTSYLQFVDKRNSQSLDVGTVIQVKSISGAATLATAAAGHPIGPPPPSKPPTEPAAARQQQQQQQSRKSSNASLLNGLEGAAAAGATAGQPSIVGSQRCRRCLIRFEPGQLAVVAPNFAIGTGLYHQLARALPAGETAGESRRGSISAQQQSASPDDRVVPLVGKPPSGATGQPPATAKQHLAMFHPNCFTCSTCKEFLVDLVYCLRDGKLYCLRHYGESIRPRCNWCQEVSLLAMR